MTSLTSAQGADHEFTALRVAYKRGVAWALENPGANSAWVEKAAYDYADKTTASPPPAASPASPSGVREQGFVDGYQAALRDVDVFRIKIAEPFDSAFATHKAFVFDMLKRNADKLRASLASDATPAPTSGSVDGGEAMAISLYRWRVRGEEWSAEWFSCAPPPPNDDIEIETRTFYSALAKPAAELAGGDVQRELAELKHEWPVAKPVEAFIHRLIAALSSSAGPAVEVVREALGIVAERLARETVVSAVRFLNDGADESEHENYVLANWKDEIEAATKKIAAALYAHPAPATVEISDAMIDAGCAAWVKLYPAFDGEKLQPTAGDVVKAILSAALAPATEKP